MIQKISFLSLFIVISACNTVTGTVEGTSKDRKGVKTIHHYSTCVFTKKQCGDLDLED